MLVPCMKGIWTAAVSSGFAFSARRSGEFQAHSQELGVGRRTHDRQSYLRRRHAHSTTSRLERPLSSPRSCNLTGASNTPSSEMTLVSRNLHRTDRRKRSWPNIEDWVLLNLSQDVGRPLLAQFPQS